LVKEAKFIEDQVNGLWGSFYEDTEMQARAHELMIERTKLHIKDERLLKGFAPKFGIGCRRITPGDPYMAAIQKDNVDVHFTLADRITETGVIGGDGIEREVDTIVCATGFDVTYRPRFDLVGEGGIDLGEKWKDVPESYLSMCVPQFPNMVQFIGPTFPVENGSVMGALWAVAEYTLLWIAKMQREGVRSWAPKQAITDLFNDHAQEWITHTVWKSSCRSWYKDNDTGRVNAVWPGATLHFNSVLAHPRYEDFDIKYIYKNPWAHLGMGWTTEWTQNKDKSPYLATEQLDPLWLETIKKGEVGEDSGAVGGPKGEPVGAEVVNGVTGEGTKVEVVVQGHDSKA
jgi:hydroxyversicolorone monooxygenase